ncbi:MAG: sulfur carrier protein ThiS [Bacteroidales bacterium]
MKITLNNRQEEYDRESMTLTELIELKSFSFRLLVTKVNGKLIRKEQRNETIIHDGDQVAIIHMISGG